MATRTRNWLTSSLKWRGWKRLTQHSQFARLLHSRLCVIVEFAPYGNSSDVCRSLVYPNLISSLLLSVWKAGVSLCFFSSFFLGFLCAVHSSRFGGSRNLLFSENCVLKIAVWSTLGWLATCPCPSTTTRRQTPAFQTTLREKEGGNPSRPFVTSCPAEDLLLVAQRLTLMKDDERETDKLLCETPPVLWCSRGDSYLALLVTT